MKKYTFLLMVLCALGLILLVMLLLRSATTPTPPVDPENPSDTDPVTRNPVLIETYRQFVTLPQTISPWATLKDSGPAVPLDTWAQTIGVRIEPRIKALLDQGVWTVYRCDDREGKPSPSLVFSMYFALQPNYPGNLYKDQLAFLADWERSMLQDLRPVLFPNEPSDATVEQLTEFTTKVNYEYAGLREAKARSSTGVERTIGYAFIGDELMVGNDISCIIQVQQYLFNSGEGEFLFDPARVENEE